MLSEPLSCPSHYTDKVSERLSSQTIIFIPFIRSLKGESQLLDLEAWPWLTGKLTKMLDKELSKRLNKNFRRKLNTNLIRTWIRSWIGEGQPLDPGLGLGLIDSLIKNLIRNLIGEEQPCLKGGDWLNRKLLTNLWIKRLGRSWIRSLIRNLVRSPIKRSIRESRPLDRAIAYQEA